MGIAMDIAAILQIVTGKPTLCGHLNYVSSSMEDMKETHQFKQYILNTFVIHIKAVRL